MAGRVSVVVPTFQRAPLVGQALASIAAVDWPDVEVIVVDDGSTDGTDALIARIRAEGYRWPLIYLPQSNKGAAAARNAGRNRARGEYLYHLDSDDLVAPDAFDVLIAAMQRTGAAYALGNIENTDLAGVRDHQTPFGIRNAIADDILLSSWYTHAALYRRQIIDRIGGYAEILQSGEDTEMHWRVMAAAGLPALHDGIIGARRLHGLGHLGVPRDRAGNVNAMLTVYEQFFDACPKAFCTPLNALRVGLFGVERGRAGDGTTRRRCQDLLARVAACRPEAVSLRLWPVFLRPGSAFYYLCLDALVTGLKIIWRFGRRMSKLLPRTKRRSQRG